MNHFLARQNFHFRHPIHRRPAGEPLTGHEMPARLRETVKPGAGIGARRDGRGQKLRGQIPNHAGRLAPRR